MELLTYNTYMKLYEWRRDIDRVQYAIDYGDYPFSKMCRANKMSRKRLKKLIMATGESARNAEKKVRQLNEIGCPYLYWWGLNLIPAVKRIAKRHERPFTDEVQAIFDVVAAKDIAEMNELITEYNIEIDDLNQLWNIILIPRGGIREATGRDAYILMLSDYILYLKWCEDNGREGF